MREHRAPGSRISAGTSQARGHMRWSEQEEKELRGWGGHKRDALAPGDALLSLLSTKPCLEPRGAGLAPGAAGRTG